MTNMFNSAPIAGARTSFPDAGLTIDYFVTEEVEVCVMHDRPFYKTPSWIEYNLTTSRLEIIMEDGDVRDYGLAVPAQLSPYFQNTHSVYVIQLNIEKQDADATIELPLIVHRT